MLMSKINKNRQRMRYDGINQGKPDLNTALPVRQTASIFKQPVTKVTNHHQQTFLGKKIKWVKCIDIAEELVKTMELPKDCKVWPWCTDETLLSAIASALHTSTMPITGQLSAAVEKNPGVWLNTSQPLCKAFMVDRRGHQISKDGSAPLDKDIDDEEEEKMEENRRQEAV
ncbi:hypothetical protein GDO86_000970 [Hymenochirus boettgeri]|uniref:Uncharacterized protein n=1 Tax=Hymenochirus boettgeri TaxID=247094 RepID=A0A8T2KF92_9PIPI|nr:hypothetical protein GDO86_000967 [Hymenochirus boettgeri]KAG8454550.1 hypothetical protein GDO86_000970 [Hymenochirus boettgeri]